MTTSHKRRILWTLASLVVLWRLAAPAVQHRAVAAGSLSETDLLMFVTLGIMGLGFVACGLIAEWWTGTHASWLFGLYAALEGLHWGGPLGTTPAWWIGYLFASGFIAQALFLHFALIFPEPVAAAARRSTWLALYGPVALAGGVAAALIIGPTGRSAEALSGVFWILHTIVPNLCALLAIVVIVTRAVRAGSAGRRERGLSFLLLGVLLGTLPYLGVAAVQGLGGSMPGGDQPYNLFFLLIPAGACAAILRCSHRSAR